MYSIGLQQSLSALVKCELKHPKTLQPNLLPIGGGEIYSSASVFFCFLADIPNRSHRCRVHAKRVFLVGV